MECNKEEAIRAKEIAEKKMQNKDFIGARKFFVKAQKLFPELENIPQLLTVCEVHCAASVKVNGVIDWYGILQVESAADELSIKRQYRKLALLLHPDKNKFEGAEAAFKLVGEAHMTLNDPQKRSFYDQKRTDLAKTAPPPRQPSQQPKRTDTYNTNTTMNFNGLNRQQQQQSSFSGSQTFWTKCQSCGIRHQCSRDMLNRFVCCKSCLKIFIACEIIEPAMPCGVKSNAGVGTGVPYQQDHVSGQSKEFRKSACYFKGNQKTQPGINLGHADGSFERENKDGKTEAKDGGAAGDAKIEKKHAEMNQREQRVEPSTMNSSKVCTRRSQKKGKRLVMDPIDSDSADSEDFVMEDDSPATPNAGENATYNPRRSTRKKQNVTYNEETNNNDDFSSSPVCSSKRPRKGPSSPHPDGIDNKFSDAHFNGVKSETHETDQFPASTDNKQNGSTPCVEKPVDLKEQANKDRLHEGSQEAAQKKEISDSDRDTGVGSLSNESPDLGIYTYPDPEFCDFEKYRDTSQFAVGQIWALYDNLDAMPRFYALISHVSGPKFKVQFTWLEYDPVTELEIEWSDEELPVACGNFKLGKSEISQDRLMFSHVISWEKGRKKNTYSVYPRKGEVWALYKGWNIGWSSDADNHRTYEYEIVEVLSDFTVKNGITVIPLVKIKGFVSLFTQAKEKTLCIIPASEILRFSHAVPFYWMNGTEREGAPGGCFELDAVSLPGNLQEAFPSVTLGDCVQKARKLENECNGSSLHNATNREKFETPDVLKTERLKDQHLSSAENQDHVHGAVKHDDSSQPLSYSPYTYQLPDSEFYNFEEAKSCNEFQRGQIWALYSDLDGFPKYYGWIRRVEQGRFGVHVLWLEACPSSEEEKRWLKEELPVGCGTFRIAKQSITYDNAEAFSHSVELREVGRTRCLFEILPCIGEIWAVYKNWRVGWSLSDIENCEYGIVAILNRTDDGTEVSLLKKVDGYRAVFMTEAATGTMGIPVGEYLRFSHRIPAHRLTEERGGKLRGYWELDPASVPEIFLFTNSE